MLIYTSVPISGRRTQLGDADSAGIDSLGAASLGAAPLGVELWTGARLVAGDAPLDEHAARAATIATINRSRFSI
jgi:hypothetical protein